MREGDIFDVDLVTVQYVNDVCVVVMQATDS